MGKKKGLHDCVFTVRLQGQPDQKFDYTGLLSWLVEDPNRIFAVAPDFAGKSRGVRNILQSRPPGEPRELTTPVAPPAPPAGETLGLLGTEPIDDLSLLDMLDDVIGAQFGEQAPAAAPKETKPPTTRKPRERKTGTKPRGKKTSVMEDPEVKAKLAEAARNASAAAKGLGRLADRLLKAATPGPNTNSMLGAGWDDATYQEVKVLAKEILDSYRAVVTNLRDAAQLIIGQLATEHGLSKEQIQALKPYLVKFFQEMRTQQEETKEPKKGPVTKQGVVEAASVNELLDAKVAAYVEIGDFEGEHGIYFVYNDGGRGVKRVLLENAGKDFSAALRKAQQIARQVHQGVDTPATRGITYRSRVANQPIGVSTTARNVTKFSDNQEIGQQPLGWGDKHPDVKLKDLFDVDPDYALYAAKNATDGVRAITVREYLRSRPEFLKSLAEQRSTLQAFKNQVARVTKERALVRAFKDLRVTATVATDHLAIKDVNDEQAEYLASIGATWNGELGQFQVSAQNIKRFLDALVERSRTNQGVISEQDATEGTGIRNPRILEIRRRNDAIPDQSALGVPVGELVEQDTQNLMMRGTQFGIPQQIVEEQIEDVAKAAKVWDRSVKDKGERGLFILASDPGSGKTFVLGGTIRELRRRGAKRIVFVTLNEALIEQVKNDLSAYGVNDVQFITYSGLRNGKLGGTENEQDVESTDVVIFDEAHMIKKIADAQTAKVAQRVLSKNRMAILSSATPYENPVQMEYLAPTGLFDDFGGFANFAEAYGAQVIRPNPEGPNADQPPRVFWLRDVYSDSNAAAARAWLNKKGIYSQRTIQLPMELVDMRLTPTAAEFEMKNIYNSLERAMELAPGAIAGMDKAYIMNFMKRVLEASKVQSAIAEAKAAIARGRFPIIFTETKVEREIDVDYWNEQEVVYAQDAAEAKRTGGRVGPRSDYGLPPSRMITELFTVASGFAGTSHFVIPAAEEVIAQEIDQSDIAVFNGSVSDAQARKNLKDWRLGTKPLLLATMAKGGTGLSLHDTTGTHPTTMIVLNLPWTATQVKQVAQRNARYGLKSQAEIVWLFADDLALDKELGRRVGGRIADMSRTVTGESSDTAQRLQDWNLDELSLNELVDMAHRREGVLRTETGEEMTLTDFEPTNMVAAMIEALTQARESGTGLIDNNTVTAGALRDVLRAAHGLTLESANEVILHFAGHYEPAMRESSEGLILVPFGSSDNTLTAAQIKDSLVADGTRYAGVQLRTPASPDASSNNEPIYEGRMARGDKANVLLVDNGYYQAHYEIRELQDLIPSHRGSDFQPNRDYYLVNDRDYTNNPANQTAVISQAQNYQPERIVNTAATSVEGPPMILPTGIVLGGNSRAMTLDRVYSSHPESAEAYRQLLTDRAQQFGFSPEQVGEFEKPVLVRVIDDLGSDSEQSAITRLNADPQKALSETEQSIAMGRSITPEVISVLGVSIGRSGSLAAALADDGLEIVNTMISSGMVAETDRPRWIDLGTGKVTEFTKEQLKSMLVGSLFDSVQLMEQTPAEIMNRLERIAPQLLRLQGSTWDIRQHFPGAIRAIIQARRDRIKYKELARIQSMNPVTGEIAPTYNLVEMALATAIGEATGARQALEPFEGYVDQAMVEITGQGGLFAQAMPKLAAFEKFFPAPTGEAIPQVVLDAQKRLDKFFKGGSTQMNFLGTESFARLGDLAIVAAYKLYKAGQTVLQWRQSIADFLGMRFPRVFGNEAAIRRELLAQVATRRLIEEYNKLVDEAEKAGIPESDEEARYFQERRLAAFRPVGIEGITGKEPKMPARLFRKRLKRGIAFAWIANVAVMKLFAKMQSYQTFSVQRVRPSSATLSHLRLDEYKATVSGNQEALTEIQAAIGKELLKLAKQGPDKFVIKDTSRQALEAEIMSTLNSILDTVGTTADSFMDAVNQWAQTPTVTPMLENLVYGAGYGLMLYGATKVVRSRRTADAQLLPGEIEDDAEYATDPHSLIRDHLASGTPVGTFYRLYGKEEGGLPSPIRSRQVRDAIRTGYAEGLYDDGDLEVLQVDQFGEDLYKMVADEPAPAIYPEMEFVEARRTAGGRWRVAHKVTGDNLIPGESFPSAQAARKAYQKLLNEFKADQERGETLPAVVRAERAMLDYDKNGTPLPATIPIPLEKFQRRARSLFDRGLISRKGYSGILRYIATNPTVETREAAASTPQVTVQAKPVSPATPAVKSAATRAINNLRTGAQAITTSTRPVVIEELRWRLENAREDLNLTDNKISVLEKAITDWENRNLRKAKRISKTEASDRQLFWDVATGRFVRSVASEQDIKVAKEVGELMKLNAEEKVKFNRILRAKTLKPRQLGALIAFSQTAPLTAEEQTRVDNAIAGFRQRLSPRGLQAAEKHAQGLLGDKVVDQAERKAAGQRRQERQAVAEAAVKAKPAVDPSAPMFTVVQDAIARLNAIAGPQGKTLGLGKIVDQVAVDGIRLYQQGLARMDWLKEMVKRFGRNTVDFLKKAWEIIKSSLKAAFLQTSPTLKALNESLQKAVTPERRRALQAAIDKEVQQLASAEELARPQPFSIATLRSLTGLDQEMAESVLELYLAMGIDISKIKVVKGVSDENKARVEFAKDGTALIRAFQNADVTSFAHEGAHIYRRWLLNTANGHTEREIKMLERWAGAVNGNWTTEADEKFARAFERYLRNGKAPIARLEALFSRMAAWFRQIYRTLAGSPIAANVPKSAQVVFEKMFAGEEGAIKNIIPAAGEARLNQFIGAKGRQGGDALARQMEAALAPPGTPLEAKEKAWATIAKATGWHRIVETEPFMFEIDSSKARVKNPQTLAYRLRNPLAKAMYGVHTADLEQALDYPELFAAYPNLRTVDVELIHDDQSPRRGSYSKVGKNVTLRVRGPLIDKSGRLDEDMIKSTLLHEVQHAIQMIEGFSSGSNVAAAEAQKLASEAWSGREAELRELYPNWFSQYDMMMGAREPEEDVLGLGLEGGVISVPDSLTEWIEKLKELHQDAPKDIQNARRYLELSKYDIYRAVTGEAMARLVQARRAMSQAEREALPPREHLKQMLDEEGLLAPYSPYPEHALLPGLIDSLGSPQESAPAPQAGSDRRLRALEGRLATITDEGRRRALLKQISEERAKLTKAGQAPSSKGPEPPQRASAKLDLSKYDDMTVSDLVDQLANAKTAKGLVSIRDAKPEVKVGVYEQNLIDLAGLPRAIMSSADLSAPLRQGSILTLPPQQWGRAAKAFGDMLSALGSQSAFSDFRMGITGHKLFTTAQAAGLYLATEEIGENVITGGEETFVSRLARELPIMGPLVKASERAYITYLDSLRLSTFAKYVYQIERQGGTQQQRREAVVAAAKWINIATGRGTFEGKLEPLERAMPLLGTVFFAPRYVQSRLQLINPRTYFQQPAVVRRQAWLDLMGYAATVAAVSFLAGLAGADIEWDPEDEDFLKIRFGNLRYDFLAGTQQVMRLTFLVSKSWGTAMIDSLEEAVTGERVKRPYTRTGGDIIGRFLRSKLAPIPSFFVDMQQRKDFIGRRFELKQATIDRVVPMYWRESTEAYLRAGWSGALQQVPSAFGVGVSDYEKVSGIFSLGDTPYTAELARKQVEIGRLKPRDDESKDAFKRRAERTQSQLDNYGTQLVVSDRYQRLSEEGKATALRILRQRIGRGESEMMLRPEMITLAAVMADIKRKTNPQAKNEEDE